MKDVVRRIRTRAAELARHRLFTDWLADPGVDPQTKLSFCPAAIDFVMGFRDFNQYYVIYPSPHSELERALNEHALEDATHSAFFLEDWRALDIDELLGFRPRDIYWWITSDRTLDSRRADFDLICLTYHHPDPLLRFAIIESMEAAGNVFFTRTVPIAEPLAARIGRPLPYFGQVHLDRETGHLQSDNERLFTEADLSKVQRDTALRLVDRVFEIFDHHFTIWADFGRGLRAGRFKCVPAEESNAVAALRPACAIDATAYMQLDYPGDVAGAGQELAAQRQQAFANLWQMPFCRWVRTPHDGDFKALMRSFLLYWVVDNWTCADYFILDTTYPAPLTPLERGINRLSTLYASEMNRRYLEWELLELDDETAWGAGEALRHYWLDERVGEFRRIFAELRKLTLRHDKPLHRFWIMKCFVRFGDALMHSLGVAMRHAREDDESFITFAGFPERLHPDLPPDPEADRAIAEIERQPVTREDFSIIRQIIAETSRQEAARYECTWRALEERGKTLRDLEAEHVATG